MIYKCYIESEYYKEAIIRVNQLRNWLNRNMEEIVDICRNASWKADGSLYKKDHDKMNLIIDRLRAEVKYSRGFLDTEYSLLWFEADIHFPCHECGVSYAKEHLFLNSREEVKTPENLEILSLKQVEKDFKNRKEVKDRISKLEAQLSQIEIRLTPLER